MNILWSISHIILILAAIGGFFIALYIHHTKRRGENVVCPLDFKCDQVIRSKYSKLFGINVENWGIAYYSFTALSYIIFLAFPAILNLKFVLITLILSMIAFIFSIYLTFIQAFKLREWCTWCLISASFCTIIFLSAWLGSDYSLGDIAGYIK